jgi:hypothetical protein
MNEFLMFMISLGCTLSLYLIFLLFYTLFLKDGRVKEIEGNMKLIKWKGNPDEDENHRYDYRWIKEPVEREKWIRKHWEVEENIK